MQCARQGAEVAGGKLQLLIHRGERRRRDPYRDDEAVRCMYEHDTGDRAVEPDLVEEARDVEVDGDARKRLW